KRELNKVELEGRGSFTIAERKSYSYSKGLEEKQNKIRVLKKQEEDEGKAVVKSSIKYLRYNPLKRS
ncbi:MAG: hypothetical protein PF549_01035, partial [Patescibacteria group bacterium]|nr:hypothetical protein [Patescibacteria group bacterium]